MNAAASSWRTCTNRIRSWRVRSASMIPLMPSPGRPKTTSTPQSCRVSIRMSAAVDAIVVSFLGRGAIQSGEHRALEGPAELLGRWAHEGRALVHLSWRAGGASPMPGIGRHLRPRTDAPDPGKSTGSAPTLPGSRASPVVPANPLCDDYSGRGRRSPGGGKKEKAMPAQKSTARKKPARDAIALLKEDHERVRKLLGELEESTDRAEGKREKLLSTIEDELKIHTKIEEDVFYPAFFDAARTSDDKELYYEAIEEHHVVDLVMPAVKSTDPSTNEFAAKAKVLKDLVEHHAEEEESEMFPRARKLMNRERLMEVGEGVARAQAQ